MKKLLALILVAVMCMSFAACMETDEPVKDDSPANASTESVSDDAKEETYGLNETAVFKNLKFTATAIEESEGIDYFEAESGKIYEGANIENASYSPTVCAERVAIFKAVFENERNFKALAVYGKNMAYPCGVCRQVLSEFCSPQMKIYVVKDEDNFEEIT